MGALATDSQRVEKTCNCKVVGEELTRIGISEKVVVGALGAEVVDEPESYLAGKIARCSNGEL